MRVLLAYAMTLPFCSRTAPKPTALASVNNVKSVEVWPNCGYANIGAWVKRLFKKHSLLYCVSASRGAEISVKCCI